MSFEERRHRLGLDRAETSKPLSALLVDRHVLGGLAILMTCLGLLAGWQKGLFPTGETGLPKGEFSLPAIEGLRRPDGRVVPGVSERDFAGQVTVVNVWAAWCPYCRGEHADLMGYSRTKRVRFVGIDYRDEMSAAQDYLRREGFPTTWSASTPRARSPASGRAGRTDDLRHRPPGQGGRTADGRAGPRPHPPRTAARHRRRPGEHALNCCRTPH